MASANNVLLQLNKASSYEGRTRGFYQALTAGPYNVKAYVTQSELTSLELVILQNGLAVYESILGFEGNHVEVKQLLNCAASDIIEVRIDTDMMVDINMNTVKSVVTIGDGYQ